jgi:hypothetical protein
VGIYNNHITSYLQIEKANICGAARRLEHPIRIKESLGMIRGKNDKVDAQRIALYARAASATKTGMMFIFHVR